MKVVLISDMYPMRGKAIGSAAVLRQTLEIASRGVEVDVLHPIPVLPGGWSWDGDRLRQACETNSLNGIPVRRLPYSKVLPFGLAPGLGARLLGNALQAALERLDAAGRVDLVHAHSLFPHALAAVAAAKSLGRPVVVTAHGSDVHTHPYRSARFARQIRRSIEGCDRVLAVCSALRDQILEIGQPRRAPEVAYLGVDNERFRPAPSRSALRARLQLPERGRGICFVGRLVREKGLNELLAAFEKLTRVHPDWWLLLVGDGPMRTEVESQVREKRLDDRVLMVGARPHEELPAWLGACDLFTLPSYNEGLPNAVLEAMACGLPSVVTDVGGLREAVGESGVLVPANEVDALSDAIERVLTKPDEATRLGALAVERVRQRFTWKKSTDRILQVYRGVLDDEQLEAGRS